MKTSQNPGTPHTLTAVAILRAPLALAALLLSTAPARAADLIIGGDPDSDTYHDNNTYTLHDGTYYYENIPVGGGLDNWINGSENQLNISGETTAVNVSQSIMIGVGIYSTFNSIIIHSGALNATGSDTTVTIGYGTDNNSLIIGDNGAEASFNIQGNSTVTIGESEFFSGGGNSNKLVVENGGTLDFQGTGGLIIVGDSAYGNGSTDNLLEIQGTANTYNIAIGRYATGNELTIGSTGILNIQGNSTVTIGAYGDSNKLVVENGGTLDFQGTDGLIIVGDNGYDTGANHNLLEIQGTANTYDIVVGRGTTGNKLTIGTTGILNTKGDIAIGTAEFVSGRENGNNSLTIENGGQLNFTGANQQLTIGVYGDSNKLVVENGGTLDFQGTDGSIIVGDNGYDTGANHNLLEIQGTANTYDIVVGRGTTGNELTIGTTGILNTKGNITIGTSEFGSWIENGANSLTIETGGKLNFTGGPGANQQLTIGESYGGSNTVTVKAGGLIDISNGHISMGTGQDADNYNNKFDISGEVRTGTLSIGSDYNQQSQVVINAGGKLIASSDVFIGSDSSSSNTLHVNGGEFYAGSFQVGSGTSISSTFRIDNGGQAYASTVNIGYYNEGNLEYSDGYGGGHQLIVGSSNSQLIVSGGLNVGVRGTAVTATIAEGGYISAGTVTIGTGERTSGSYLTTQGVLETNRVTIGYDDYNYGNYDVSQNSHLTIQSGGELTTTDTANFSIGNAFYSNANSLNISSGGQLNAASDANFTIGGYSLDNTLNINGALNIAGNGTFAIGASGAGGHDNAININGGKVGIGGTGIFVIGDGNGINYEYNNNRLDITDGGQLNVQGSADFIVGNASIGNRLYISANSELNLTENGNGTFVIGKNSYNNTLSIRGQVYIEDAGTFTIGDGVFAGFIGDYYGGGYDESGPLYNNYLDISDGGQLDVQGKGTIIVGKDGSPGNSLSISGPNSQLNLYGEESQVIVGNAYAGDRNTLIITDGGQLNLDGDSSTVAVGYNGSSGNRLTIGNGGKLTLNQYSQLNLGGWGGANNIFTVESGGTLDATSSTFWLAPGDGSNDNTLDIRGTASLNAVFVGDSEEWGNAPGNGNRLHVDGTLNAGHIELHATSILSGHGKINVTGSDTLILHSDAILDISGDAGTGTLTINGSPVTLEAGAILDFNLSPASGASDRLALDGQSIDLSSVLFRFDVLAEFTTDQAFSLITGAASILVDTATVYDLGGGYTGHLSIIGGGSTLQLSASFAVPEPSAYAALAGLAMVAWVALHRRRRRRH
jgi:hypothetical protein